MASFSSLGIGLGGNVDVNGLIKASVDAVKLPITQTGGLQQQAAVTKAKVSAFGQLKSMVSTLSDALGKLTSVTGWNGVTATSSKSDVISATAVGGAAATSFRVEVQNLAKAQSTISSSLQPSGQAVGAGTLKLEIGTWAGSPQAFTAGSDASVSIDISATDKLSDIAGKINGASGAGVTATIINDANGERLMLTSKSTGDAAGFRLSVTSDADGSTSDNAGLSRLVNGASTEYGSNANGKVNGIAVTSATNAFTNVVAGVTFTATSTTTDPVTVTVAKDTSAVKANVQAFVTAYNALNSALNDATSYDKSTKTSALLQGDSAAVNLQNTLRTALTAVVGNGSLRTLSDIGVVIDGGSGNVTPNGNLRLDTTKFDKAMASPDDVKAFFRGPDDGTTTDGFAEKFKVVTTRLLDTSGFFATKSKTYDAALKRNTQDTQTLLDRADRLQKSLTERYTALDKKMSGLNALNTYIGQQVTTWNKSR